MGGDKVGFEGVDALSTVVVFAVPFDEVELAEGAFSASDADPCSFDASMSRSGS